MWTVLWVVVLEEGLVVVGYKREQKGWCRCGCGGYDWSFLYCGGLDLVGWMKSFGKGSLATGFIRYKNYFGYPRVGLYSDYTLKDTDVACCTRTT